MGQKIAQVSCLAFHPTKVRPNHAIILNHNLLFVIYRLLLLLVLPTIWFQYTVRESANLQLVHEKSLICDIDVKTTYH